MAQNYEMLFDGVLIVLGLFMFAGLARSIIGPRIADRVIGINMTGTIVIMMIGILTLRRKEGYLIDVAMIYALLSFLAVVVLCRIFIGVWRAQKEKENQNG